MGRRDRPAGDTVVDGTRKPRPEGRADLIHTRATYMKDGVLLTAQTAEAADPRKDPHWASDSTFVSWELDTNGDAVPDYERRNTCFVTGRPWRASAAPTTTNSSSAV